jgi:anti-sigma B factor antagonist
MQPPGDQPVSDTSAFHATRRDDGFVADVARVDGRAVVTVRGEIDISTADAFWSAVDRACALSPRLVIDLTGTEFMDSTGLAVLVRAHRRVERSPDGLVVRVSATSPVRKVMAITGLDRLVTVDSA